MGHHNIQFAGDASSNNGAWSPPTSRANFCEEDYVISFYLAEFINALTNISYVYLALRAMYPPRPTRSLLRPKYDFMSLSLLTLGIGSFLFHATLRQTLEFVDEFSMLGLTWSMLQASLTARQTPKRARLITVGLAVAYLSFSAFYIWSAKIIYQVFAFTGALFGVLFRGQYMFHLARPAFPEAKRRDWNWRIWKALGICVFGYVLWTVDLEYCAELRAVRQRVGLPWAWLFDQSMQVAREIREEERERKSE
ncbi:ceramidase [Parachaetomium inaequale]|uniref:Ceramidase n=1 Tax=Parachaetomium inaequale TaxID=2588326 RepID=A0AAN6PC47_9PEZI|nr:ceramidase [Parachaetomium inaequale]